MTKLTMASFYRGLVALALSSFVYAWLINSKVPLLLVFIPFSSGSAGGSAVLVKRQLGAGSEHTLSGDDDLHM
jgi:hypothetical protein